MNREDIIRMAREAGLGVVKNDLDECVVPVWHLNFENLERFAALVAAAAYEKGFDEGAKDFEQIVLPAAIAAEREACAKVCEELRDDWLKGLGRYEFMGEGADFCADAIRARSNP